jgi:hypothetical protein
MQHQQPLDGRQCDTDDRDAPSECRLVEGMGECGWERATKEKKKRFWCVHSSTTHLPVAVICVFLPQTAQSHSSTSPRVMFGRRLAGAVRASFRLMRAHRPAHAQALAAAVGLTSAVAPRPVSSEAAPSPLPALQSVDAHLRVMARYHTWACRKLLAEVGALSEEEYRRDVGLAFRSVHGTLVHMLAADEVWTARLVRGDVAGVEHLWAAESAQRWEEHVVSREEVARRLIRGCEVGRNNGTSRAAAVVVLNRTRRAQETQRCASVLCALLLNLSATRVVRVHSEPVRRVLDLHLSQHARRRAQRRPVAHARTRGQPRNPSSRTDFGEQQKQQCNRSRCHSRSRWN